MTPPRAIEGLGVPHSPVLTEAKSMTTPAARNRSFTVSLADPSATHAVRSGSR